MQYLCFAFSILWSYVTPKTRVVLLAKCLQCLEVSPLPQGPRPSLLHKDEPS